MLSTYFAKINLYIYLSEVKLSITDGMAEKNFEYDMGYLPYIEFWPMELFAICRSLFEFRHTVE